MKRHIIISGMALAGIMAFSSAAYAGSISYVRLDNRYTVKTDDFDLSTFTMKCSQPEFTYTFSLGTDNSSYSDTYSSR